ncbi:unnamed protein product [Prunus armeniaca]
MGATSTTNESGGSTNNETDSSLVFGGCKRKAMMEKWKKIQQESENVEFDILGWWRINGLKYPTLASIAKDVLAIPTSTIALESCFSTSGRVIDSFQSSLSPRMVEALICSQNWIRSEDISSLQYVPSIEEMEFYESIEIINMIWAFENGKIGLNPKPITTHNRPENRGPFPVLPNFWFFLRPDSTREPSSLLVWPAGRPKIDSTRTVPRARKRNNPNLSICPTLDDGEYNKSEELGTKRRKIIKDDDNNLELVAAEEEDRISKLPHEVVLSIVSLLTLKEAATTSTLSRR